ncbi:hypothetical protein PAMP_008399 [Pampus punctatissimus]
MHCKGEGNLNPHSSSMERVHYRALTGLSPVEERCAAATLAPVLALIYHLYVYRSRYELR